MNNHYEEKMIKIISRLLVVTYVLLLIPVLYIGRYDYHCADDFGFSAASHVAWEDTHSFIEVLQAAGETVVDRWHTWQGTFTTMFLMALEPGLFGDAYYHFVPWIMIGAMTASTMYLMNVILVKFIECNKSTWIVLSMIYLIFALECIVDPLQGFFWYNGAVHYMIPHSIAFILIALLIKLRIRTRKVMLCVLTSLISFLLGGSNFITALGTGVGLAYAIMIGMYFKQKKYAWIYIAPMIAYIPAFFINVLAPGNSVRQAVISNHPGPIKAIMLSFYFCIEHAFGEWLNWKSLAFVLLCMPFSIIIVKNIKTKYQFEFRYPLIVLLLSFCFLSSLYAPTAYAAGDVGAGRVENIIFLDYVMLILFNEVYVIGWLDTRLQLSEKIHLFDFANKNYLIFCGFVIVGIVFCTILTILRDENSFTTSSAVASIVSGEAARYGDETKERTLMIENCNGDELVVPRFVEMPYLLYMDDIVPDSDDWRNNSMERYYRIEQIEAYSIQY